MRVKSFKAICANPRLQDLLVGQRSKDKVRSRDFVRTLLDTKQEELFQIFLGSLYEQRRTEYKEASQRLFRSFARGFDRLSEDEKRQFSDPFHKEVQKVASAFAKRNSSLDSTFLADAFKLKDLEKLLMQLPQGNYKRTTQQETDVTKCSLKHEDMRKGIANFQYQNNRAYPHSVIQLGNSPSMVIIGTPRLDRKNSLERFFSVMLEENVEVIVALNTVDDWEEAIAYYEPEQMKSVQLEGHSISCKKSVILYEGDVAANIPKKLQDVLTGLTQAERDELLAQKKYKKYRPRIIERTFVVRENESGARKKITQLHYENWPDRQAAPDLDAWWILLRRQFELQNKSIAIHCQGGIGRTNVHAILTCLVSEMNALQDAGGNLSEAEFNVPLTMYRLKKQAPRLGGLVCGKRFFQIYQMANRYYKEMTFLEQKSQ